MAIDERLGQVSSLLDYLPAIYQDESGPGRPNFLGRFLLAFERILLGLGDVDAPGLEEILGGIPGLDKERQALAGIHRYFEPGADLEERQRAPSAFLQWLAGWVALALREDWDELRQRDLIGKAVQLYRLRGTRQGVEEFLRIYTRMGVEIEELNTPFQLGVHSTVGKDTLLDGGAPFFFNVRIFVPTADPELRKDQQRISEAIVDLQKPAHTHYRLFVETPMLQIGVHSRVGVDTLLG